MNWVSDSASLQQCYDAASAAWHVRHQSFLFLTIIYLSGYQRCAACGLCLSAAVADQPHLLALTQDVYCSLHELLQRAVHTVNE